MTTISEELAVAIEHHQHGRLPAAEQMYRRILQLEPNHADALHLLGVIAHQVGNHVVAVDFITQSIQQNANEAHVHNNLGGAYRALGQIPEATGCFRRALELNANYSQALINLGNCLKDQRQIEESIDCFRRAVELKPGLAEAHFHLGNALSEQGSLEGAIASFLRTLEIKPDYSEARINLGNLLKIQGKIEDAIACYQRTLELQPGFATAHVNLGIALHERQQTHEAIVHFQAALTQNPNFAEAHNSLGNVHRDLGNLAEATMCIRRALELKPDYAEAHNNLGNTLCDQGKLSDAVDCFHRAIELNPQFATAHNNLGVALKSQGRLEEAVVCFRRSLVLKPLDGETHNNLGVVLKAQGKLDDALDFCRRALQLQPDYAEAHNNLGNVLKDQGKLNEAVASYRRAVELKPDFVVAHSNQIYTQIFCSEFDGPALLDEHRQWGLRHAAPLAKTIEPHRNESSFQRRLRVGYVSPDFRNHVVGRNLLPLFCEHDHQRFEIICYAAVSSPDELTHRFQGYSDVWRETVGQTDDQLARTIRDDEVDILVDLTLHMANHRLQVFARKPAPIQVTFAGYPGTTGLDAIDYRLTDAYLDPPGLNDHLYSEKSIRLPDSFWCYDPLETKVDVSSLPALRNGYVTFGCLNNFCKVNAEMIKVWARVLNGIDRSRLILLANEGSHRQLALDVLAREGVTTDRVTFVANQPRRQYLQTYREIDIGLDTLPYNGHSTSLDSFWMGVPVVTLVGSTVTGRAGLCQLMNLGMPELIADNAEEFIRRASALALDLPRLSQLRATLRQRMEASPLMDSKGFARNIEAAYLEMWRHWCATH